MATTDFVVKNGLVVNEDALIKDTTDSTDKDTGALIVEGGVGIEKNLSLGGRIITSVLPDYPGILIGRNDSDIPGLGAVSIGHNIGEIGNYSIALGFEAGSNGNGNDNITIGQFAGAGGVGSSYDHCIAIGFGSGLSLTSGGYNTLVGYSSGSTVTEGFGNTFIGSDSGSSVTTGSYNVIIGSNDGSSIAALDDNVIISDGSGNIKLSANDTGQIYIPGQLGIGTQSPEFNVHIVGDVDPVAVAVDGYGAAGTGFITRRALGTIAAPSPLLNNTAMFTFGARGYRTSGFASATNAAIVVRATEDWTDAASGTKMSFSTTPNGTITRLDRLVIENTGQISLPANITSDSTTAGTLVVTGGVGIGENINVGGSGTFTGDVAVNGGDITTNQTTFNLINATATTLNIGGAATTVEIGATSGITNINNTLDVDQTIFTDRFVKSPYAVVAPSGAFHKGLGNIFESFTVVTGSQPTGVVADPTRRFVYVSNNGGNTVSQYSVNQSTGQLTSIATAIAAGTNPSGLDIDSNGRFLYVSNFNSNNVSQYSINQSTGALTSIATAIASGTNPNDVKVDPTGRFAYVANSNNTVSQYSINQSTGALTSITAAIAAGDVPLRIAIDPTGRFVYVINFNSNNVSQYSINQSTGALTSIATAIAAGTGPNDIKVDPSGRFVYVANSSSNNITLYSINQSTGALTSVTTISAGTIPSRIAIDPTGYFLYVRSSNSIRQYKLNQFTGELSLITTYNAPLNIDAMAIDPSSSFLYVTANTNGILSTLTINNFFAGYGTFAGNLAVTSTVSSVSTSTGALTVAGGAGITENLWVGGYINVDNLRLQDNTLSSTNTNGNIILAPAGTGNVGIGTSDPQRKLTIQSDSAGTVTTVALYNANTTNTNGTVVSFRTDTTGTGAATFHEVSAFQSKTTEHDHATRNTNFSIFTDSATTGLTEKFTVTGLGRVGIGTNDPDELLDVRGNIALTGSIIFEGATANAFETTLSVTDPTADNTITFPDAGGTVAVSVSDTSTSTQGELNLDFTLSTAGNISATGTAQGLSTTSTPSFGGISFDGTGEGISWALNTDGASIKFYNTGDSDTNSRLEFNTSDNNDEYFRWTHTPSGVTPLYESMRLVPVSDGNSELTVNGSVFAKTLYTNASIIFEGATANAFETTLTVTDPTADNTITLPDATGTVAVSVSDTTTSTQGALNLDFTLSAAGNISATGTAQGLSTTGTPTFSTLTVNGGTASVSTSTGTIVVTGGVGISGALNATTKSFDIDHPTKPGMKLRYGSLEGPEFGVYVRGKLTNVNVIELPEYWTKLVDPDSITVQLTSIGRHQQLYVEKIENNTVTIAGDDNINCFYIVHAERADVDKLVVEGE